MSGAKNRLMSDLQAGDDNGLYSAVATRTHRVTDMVASAIRNKQVLLAYQPVMQARDQSKVAFYEALIRVIDASGRIIPAGTFMSAVEQTDLGRQLDTLALDKGLQALEENPGLRLSINMSPRSIGYGPWNHTLERWINQNEFIGERLILEITETSALMDPELVADFMNALRMKGISFAMDDFGAGCTGLRYFKEFSFDVVKIDGKFIRGIAKDGDNRAITSAMISIAKHFDMLTVAEFVENAEDAAVLVELGVDCLQGHHFSAATTRPVWMSEARLSKAV